MAQSAVVLDKDEFCRAFLPLSTHTPPLATASRNAFESLQDADELSDDKISELFVSFID